MAESKRAYVFQGPGLSRETNIEAALKSLGFEIHHPFLLPAQVPSLDLRLGRDDVLILRGSWDMLPEEILYARQLGSKLVDIGTTLRAIPSAERPAVIGVGRWALALLLAGWSTLSKEQASHLNWVALPEGTRGPWLDTYYLKSLYQTRMLGRAVPELAEVDFEQILLTADKLPVGWRSDSFLHLFFVDPLALSNGSQLEGFGYENHEDLMNNTAFLRSILGVRHGGSI